VKSGSIRFRSIVILGVFSVCCLAGVAAAQNPMKALDPASAPNASRTTDSKPSPSPVVDESYVVGVDDELMISVWHEPELSNAVVVRPDGVITLPLLNEVKVIGLTPKQLQALLTEKLKGFVTDPQVTVIVRAIRSRKVYLMGPGAGRPGSYPLTQGKTVLQLIAEAGGVGQYAKVKSIYVLRDLDGKHERIAFNYKKALSGDPKDDIALQPGDMVVIP